MSVTDLSSFAHIQAHRLGMNYPKYVFLTYGTYKPQWWSSSFDDECSSDDIAYTLQYSLAVSHSNYSMRDNSVFYHFCYDAVLSLAYALKKVWAENGGINAVISSCMDDEICCQCMKNAYSGNMSSMINEQLRNTDFIGYSVSILYMWLYMVTGQD